MKATFTSMEVMFSPMEVKLLPKRVIFFHGNFHESKLKILIMWEIER